MIPDPSLDLSAFLELLFRLWADAQWAPLIAVAVIGLVAAGRHWGVALWPWLGTRRGTLTLAAVAAAALSVATQLLTGGVELPAIIITAIVSVAGAVGIHSGITSGAKGGAAEVHGFDEDGKPVVVLKSAALDRALLERGR